MKIAVIGSREFNNVKLLEEKLDPFKNQIIELISGGAQGADTLAEAWALANNVPVKLFKPDWKKFARAAGIKRNEQIIESCDYCIAFWDGKSKGTASSLKFCEKLKKPFEIVVY
jgi:hypothetical protein